MTILPSRRNVGSPDTRNAGGKMPRNKRPPASSKTPYSRPSPSLVFEKEEEEERNGNPNWISNLIYPAKVIASGAGKILSFFGADDDDDDSSSEDDVEDNDNYTENDDDEVEDVENGGSDKVFSSASKSVNKRKIEQLVMEEAFSREEGNQLIRLIRSRMMDTNGEGTPPTRNKAIMEARKWLLEKRSGSKKKLDAELESSSQFTRSEKGSPADMAKSYMQNRPAWASPSLKHVEFGSPSTLGTLPFKEETPTSTLRSSELKRSSFAAGSWNLLDEIRRVRTKATEEFTASTPLTKTSLSFSRASRQDMLGSKVNVEAAGPEESTHTKPDHVLHEAFTNSFLRDSEDNNNVQSVELQERPEAVDASVLNGNKDNEVNESRSTTPKNGSVASSYAQGLTAAKEPRPSEEENGKLVGSSQGEGIHMDNSNKLTEPIDVPYTTAVLNGSQNSSSLQEDDVSQDLSQPTVDGPTDKAKEAQKERKTRVSTRRGRGRGK